MRKKIGSGIMPLPVRPDNSRRIDLGLVGSGLAFDTSSGIEGKT